MRPLSAATLRKLNLQAAVTEEATAERNLLPDEPGWERLAGRSKEVATFAANRLKAGFAPSPAVEVAARKPGHGVRPIPYWGVLERVAYRALTTALLKDRPLLDRSPDAYLHFVSAPVAYANELQQEGDDTGQARFFFLRSPVKYVVKSDITAFYQFVDHAVLAEELLLLGGDYELIEALLDLLAETQGRTYGLPQLLDASDSLSEVYIDRVERGLLRQGLAIWRFNDDFRIACTTYSDALVAIESLDREARAAGLVISENKTVTVGFINYLFDALGKQPSDVGETISIEEVEDVIGDYTDDFGEDDADAALAVLVRAQPNAAENGINLRGIRFDDVRLLRRALNGLAKAADPRGLEAVLRLVVYVPSLTPTVVRYLLRVAGAHREATSVALDQLIAQVSLNEWQKLWLIDALRALQLLGAGEGDAQARVDWVRSVMQVSRNEPLRAIATRAMAGAGHIPLEEALSAADAAPGALMTTYVTAALEAALALDTGDVGSKDPRVDALARHSVLHAVLIRDQ